jgi:hypothetical protein
MVCAIFLVGVGLGIEVLPISKEVSLAQLVGRVDVQNHHVSSNPHIHGFSFLFILEA